MAYNSTRSRLIELTDTSAFERLCSALLVSRFKNIVPLGGSGDLGRDAIEPGITPEGFQTEDCETIFQFSLQKTWQSKLNSELEKIIKNGFKPSSYVFVTNQEVSTEATTKIQEEIAQRHGFNLQIFDLSWLQARLESPEYLQARRQYLGLDEASLPAFIAPDEYASRRIDRLRSPDYPAFFGRQGEFERIEQFVSSKNLVLLLSAPPGLGKTKLMLEAARGIQFNGVTRFLRPETDSIETHLDELDPNNPLLLFVDDGHELDNLKQLIALVLSPEFGDKIHVVMATHPWAKDRLSHEFESRAIECQEIDLAPLANSAIDQLIQLPDVGINSEAHRGAVIAVSQGNPLVAIAASFLLKETGSLSGLTRNQVVMAHFTKVLDAMPAGIARDKGLLFLAIVSATKGLEYGNFRGRLAEVLDISVDVLDGLVEKLEAVSLLKYSWRGLRVIPDLLAENLVFDMFFKPGHPFDFREMVLNPFFAEKGDRIFRSLAEAEQLGASGAAGIIDQFLNEAREVVKNADVVQRKAVLTWLKGFAGFRPEEALVVLQSMLEAPIAEPTTVVSPVWGSVTIDHGEVLRSASEILSETSRHCESCLRESLNLLYIIGAQQDHSRSNQDPWGDSVRVLTEQVLAFHPGKNFRVQQLAIEEIRRWIAEAPSQVQLDVVVSALLTLFSVSWHATNQSPIDPRSFTVRQGLVPVVPVIQDLRSGVADCLIDVYRIGNETRRVSLIAAVGSALRPYSPSGISDDLRDMLIDDARKLFSAFLSLTPEEAIPERYEVRKSVELLFRLDSERLKDLHESVSSPGIELYARLTEWPSYINRWETDWKKAEAEHTQYWVHWASQLSDDNLEFELGKVDNLLGKECEAHPNNSSAVSGNIGTLAKGLSSSNSNLLIPVLAALEAKYPDLQRYAGSLLGELYLVDHGKATETSERWMRSENAGLLREACRALLWIPDEQFGEPETKQVAYILTLHDNILDRMIVGYFGSFIRKVDRHDSEVSINILKEVASRGDEFALKQIAEALAPGHAIKSIKSVDLEQILLNFVGLSEHNLDYDFELALMRLYQLDTDAWLAFWEARIKREVTKDAGERYWAVPFHLSADTDYVATSADSIRVLEKFLEWSTHQEFAYEHSGASLIKLFFGNDSEAIWGVLEGWISSCDQPKLRAVAKVLKEIGYNEQFLVMAKKLLSVTDDELVEAYLSDAVGTTGVVSGSFVPLYEKRKADFEGWQNDTNLSLRAKVFAKKQVARLAGQIELHAKEDWDE